MKAQSICATAFTILIVVFSASPQNYQTIERGKIEVGAGTLVQYEISRLLPAAFPQLPSSVRTELEKRRCLVPQTFRARRPENVISGHFRDAGTTDWAVLCSRDGASTILVFWKGSQQSVEELGNRNDANYLQAFDAAGNFGYSRLILAASPDEIRKRKQNKKVGPFDHDGIDDGFLQKGSLIHYLRDGNWIQLAGAD